MERDEVKDAVFEAIAGKISISFSERDDMDDIGLDSLDKLEVVMLLEKRFKKTIPYKAMRMGGLKKYTVGEFIDDVNRELNS